MRGHLLADTNPLGYEPRNHTELDPGSYGLSVWDLDRSFQTGGLAGQRGGLAGHEKMTLRDILDVLWDTYTGHVGSEFMHLSDPAEKRWLIERIEPQQFREPIATPRKKRIFQKLNEAEALEQFIHTKYIGHKRFSLEGAETMIPLIDAVLSDAADQDVEEVVIGMAHRGRLNVLTNIMGKPYNKVFDEFEGTVNPDAVHGSGDVKYHLGQHGTHTSPSGSTTELTLASNPSHLEAVNPVVEGMVRAKQQRIADANPGMAHKHLTDKVLPLLIHGDAAFAGQGVVAETLNLSQLEGYKTGGTVHLVVNNQIGFTTLPMHARSSAYATDIARMIQAPIFHVNGDDPEAAVRVARLALDFRQVFNKDVVIDMVCYRKYGHNEGDEPSYTQPLMYAGINGHRSVRKLYVESLLRKGEISPEGAEEVLDDFRSKLDEAFEATKELAEQRKGQEVPLPTHIEATDTADTAASREQLTQVMRALVDLPESFDVHKKLARLVVTRREKQFNDGTIDWAFAEALAFGTLLLDGTPVRLSGQDSGRATFSQRHAILYDQTDAHRYIPLNNIAPISPEAQTAGASGDGTRQARFQVYDSLLSEYAVLGFEYGYTVAAPEALVMWEAQFGDFVNGAQIMIDQFITSAEAKWGQTSRLTMLLAARLRRPGAGALVGTARTLLASLRRGQHDRGELLDACQLLPRAAAPDEAQRCQAAHHHDPEEPLAQSQRGLVGGRLERGRVPAADPVGRDRRPAPRLLLRQGGLRPAQGEGRRRSLWRRDCAPGADVPVPRRGRARRDRTSPRRRGDLAAGGAQKHGCLDVCAAVLRRHPGRSERRRLQPPRDLRRPQSRRLARHGQRGRPRQAAGAAPRRRARAGGVAPEASV